MKLTKKRISILQASIIYFLLFPGFFIYHTLIGKGLLPPFLGGYFGLISLASFPFLFFSFYYTSGRYKKKYYTVDMLFFSILCLITIVSIVNFSLSKPDMYDRYMLIQSLSIILFSLNSYFLAKSLSIENSLFKKINVVFLVIMTLIVVSNIGSSGIFYLKASSVNSDYVATYQGFARSIVVTGLIAIATSQSKVAAIFLFVLTVIALFFNGARTEFFLFITSSIALILYIHGKSTVKLLINLVLLLFLLFLINNFYESAINTFSGVRTIQIFDHGGSVSGSERMMGIIVALDTIMKNPLFGNYGSYNNILGEGTNAHNLLSAWVDLGMLGFSLYILVITIILIKLFKYFSMKNIRDAEEKNTFFFAIFTISALIVSKDYSYMLIGLMVGFFTTFQAHRLNQKSISY